MAEKNQSIAMKFNSIELPGYTDTWSSIDEKQIGVDEPLENSAADKNILHSIVIQTYENDPATRRITATHTRTGTEVFEDLKKELEAHDLLPDEYFLSNFKEQLPEDIWFSVATDFGGSEGIYIDISFSNGKGSQNFATGKTLGDTDIDFMKMSQLGATMQLMLNGNGRAIELTQEKSIEPEIPAPTEHTPAVDPGRKTIYVCSPLAGEIEENIRRAREFSKFVAQQGATPIAPHITEIFNDLIPEERELGLSMGIDYLRKADELWVFGDRISSGMAKEIELAQNELHIPIYHVGAPPYEIRNLNIEEVETMANRISQPPISEDQKSMAKQADLFQYVQSRYTVKPHGGNTYKIVEEGHDSIILFPETNTWYDYVNQFGGDPISFLMKHEGKAFIPSVKELLGDLTDPRRIFHAPAVPSERAQLVLPEHDENNKRVFAYLIKTRGIDRDIVKQCVDEDIVYQSREVINKGDKTYEFSNCIFVGKDENLEAKYASRRSMNDNSPYILKADVRNSDKHYGFAILGVASSEWVTVCESPIDAMSYASIAKMRGRSINDEHILSLGGVSRNSLDTFLEHHQNVKTINIALDNDKAGRDGGEKIKEAYLAKGYNVLESYPKEKDYNLELQVAHIRENAPHVELPAQAADNSRSFAHLTSTKMLDKAIVKEMLDSGAAYQSNRQINLPGKGEVTVCDTVFVKRDENNIPIYGISASHTSAEKTEFKVEYPNDKQAGCYLSRIGQTDTLLVFNNPVSMLTHQTIAKAKGQQPDNYICCLSRYNDAIADVISQNPDIKRIDVALDQVRTIDSQTQQTTDFRKKTFEGIKNRFGANKNMKVAERYPKNLTLNQDLVSTITKKQQPTANQQQGQKNEDIEYEID